MQGPTTESRVARVRTGEALALRGLEERAPLARMATPVMAGQRAAVAGVAAKQTAAAAEAPQQALAAPAARAVRPQRALAAPAEAPQRALAALSVAAVALAQPAREARRVWIRVSAKIGR